MLSGYHLKTLHYSLTHDLHSMRFLDLQGGGGSSIKKGMIIIILSFLKLTSELILWSSSLICRLATPPPLFKSVCYVFGSLGLSTMVESAWKWICSYWTLRCVIYIRLLLIYRVFHRPESIVQSQIYVLEVSSSPNSCVSNG